MTMNNEKKEYKCVSKNEFLDFLRSYPRKLEVDVCGVSEPALMTYNDFQLGVWPDSVVAKTYIWDNDKKSPFYKSEDEREYFIVLNHENLLRRE